MTRTKIMLGLMTIASLAAAAPVARAQAPDDEDALIRRGIALRKRGDDEAALPLFRRAYAMAHSPRAAAQLGFAEQALGRWADAEVHVSEALDATDDPWIARHRAVVSQALDTIRSHMPATAVARAAPARPAVAPPRAQPAPSLALAAAPPRAEVAPVLVARDAPEPGRGQRVAGVALAAGGLVAIGLGAAASVVSKRKVDAINEDARADRPYDEANGNWKTYDRASVALYAAGAGALVTGMVVYATAGGRETERARAPSRRTVSWQPVVAPQRVGAALAVRF